MVTVAIPVYNGTKYLEAAVKSIIDQTHRVREIIISDDRSTDNCHDLVEKIKTKYPEYTIRYYQNEKNLGYPANWNKCFKYCRSKYLIILHQDDLLMNYTVETLLNFIQLNNDLALTAGYSEPIDENGNIISRSEIKIDKIYQKGEIYEFVKDTESGLSCSSVMFDMDKIKIVGFFDENCLATDELFWPRVLTKFPIVVIGKPLIHERSHAKQTRFNDFYYNMDRVLNGIKDSNRIIDYEKRPEKKKEIKKLLTIKFTNSLVTIAHIIFIRYKSSKISLKYLYYTLRKGSLKAIFYFSFWKVLIFNFLNIIGLFSWLYKLKHKKTL